MNSSETAAIYTVVLSFPVDCTVIMVKLKIESSLSGRGHFKKAPFVQLKLMKSPI